MGYKKILIIEDAAFMRAIISHMLKEKGYNLIVEAYDGEEGAKKYTQTIYELVIIDLTMPKMDGIQTIKEIRKVDPGAKIIVCSAKGHKEFIIDAVKSGASDFIVKPFGKERLIEAVYNLIGHA